jgi:hypothetical protein
MVGIENVLAKWEFGNSEKPNSIAVKHLNAHEFE